MKAIFKDRSYDSCLLEVNGGETSVEFVASDTESDKEIYVTLDKKSVVGLIQVLAECLNEFK